MVAALLGAVGLTAVAVIAVPRIAASLHSRIAYGTWDPASPPDRIDFCGRRYYVGQGGRHTREDILATYQQFASNWRDIGRTDSGARYYAMVVPDSVRDGASPPLPCAMMLFLQVGPNSYRAYPLSGGP